MITGEQALTQPDETLSVAVPSEAVLQHERLIRSYRWVPLIFGLLMTIRLIWVVVTVFRQAGWPSPQVLMIASGVALAIGFAVFCQVLVFWALSRPRRQTIAILLWVGLAFGGLMSVFILWQTISNLGYFMRRYNLPILLYFYVGLYLIPVFLAPLWIASLASLDSKPDIYTAESIAYFATDPPLKPDSPWIAVGFSVYMLISLAIVLWIYTPLVSP